MKQNLIIIAFVILTASCNYQPKNSSTNKNESTIIIDNVDNTTIDSILKVQIKEYLTAFNGGDPETAISYCYPDMFVWMKQQYPEEYSIEAVKEMFREPIREMKKMAREKNLTYDFEIGKITKRIEIGTDKLFTVVVSIIAKKDFDEIKMGDEVIAISVDNGENWKFIQKDPETAPEILRMKYSEDIVNQIMSKN
ncbi:MAG: hypothetical protein PHE03_13250 [Bacteroidales bacterium]|nr:hypothetical protein [Bacteroidales bacterium]